MVAEAVLEDLLLVELLIQVLLLSLSGLEHPVLLAWVRVVLPLHFLYPDQLVDFTINSFCLFLSSLILWSLRRFD